MYSSNSGSLVRATLAIALMLAFVVGIAANGSSVHAAPGDVTPSSVDETLAPGESISIDKAIETAEIPENPDIVFLADSTGSMGPAISDVQSNATNVLNTINSSQPTAQFAVADYKDFGDVYAFNVGQSLTSNTTDVTNAINNWSASGGGDTPEAQLNALWEIANGATGFRSGSTRIIVWFGDASGHDPSGGHSLTDTINALTAANVQVVAVDVDSGFGDGLDNTGQATAITDATGGSLENTATDVADAILDGLGNLPVTVTPSAVGCDPLNVSFSPASQTVTSGDTATFTETIAVPNDSSLAGTTVNCTVEFTNASGNVIGTQEITVTVPIDLDASPDTATNELGTGGQTHTVDALVTSGGAAVEDRSVTFDVASGPNAGASGSGTTDGSGEASFTYTATQGLAGLGTDSIEVCIEGTDLCETVTKDWVDTTPPECDCSPTVNPHGDTEPRAGQKSPGQNEDGFYELTASDAVDPDLEIWVTDANGSGPFGPFENGDKVKITEAPNGKASSRPMGSGNGQAGAIEAHITLTGDAIVTVTDANGNTNTDTCLVPPEPK